MDKALRTTVSWLDVLVTVVFVTYRVTIKAHRLHRRVPVLHRMVPPVHPQVVHHLRHRRRNLRANQALLLVTPQLEALYLRQAQVRARLPQLYRRRLHQRRRVANHRPHRRRVLRVNQALLQVTPRLVDPLRLQAQVRVPLLPGRHHRRRRRHQVDLQVGCQVAHLADHQAVNHQHLQALHRLHSTRSA